MKCNLWLRLYSTNVKLADGIVIVTLCFHFSQGKECVSLSEFNVLLISELKNEKSVYRV